MASTRFDFFLLIPFYNDLPGLLVSLGSIHYDPSRFGVLIVDDGSKEVLCREHLAPIPGGLFVHIIRLTRNSGITVALNTGLDWLKARHDHEFIARLDCGDICSLNRFTRQVDFLRRNPDIHLLGSWVIFHQPSTGLAYRYTTPIAHREIERGMHFRNLFIHPSVMWRASALGQTGAYPDDLPYAEDYGFFCELMRTGKAAILPEPLVTCLIGDAGISSTHRPRQLLSRLKVILRYRRNSWLGLIGALRLLLLLITPYPLLLHLKRMLRPV